MDKQDLQSLYAVIEHVHRHKIVSREEEISAVPAAPEEARILQMKVGTTILMIREVTCDTLHSPLVGSNSLFLGNRYITMRFSGRRR